MLFTPPVVLSGFLHLFPYLWARDYTQLRASLSKQRAEWQHATGDTATWRRHCRSLERSGVTLSPTLPLKHLPRDEIFFSSACPAKGSAPVITYTCMQHPEDLLLSPCLSALLHRLSLSFPEICLEGPAYKIQHHLLENIASCKQFNAQVFIGYSNVNVMYNVTAQHHYCQTVW